MEQILIIQTAFIGDAILASALLESVHERWPEARIDLLVRQGNESLYSDHPFLNKLLVWHKKDGKYKSLIRLRKEIRGQRGQRGQKYTAVVNLQRFAATGFLTAFSGAKYKVGFSKNPFSFLFTHKVKHRWGDSTHEVERNMDLLRAIDENVQSKQPKLYPRASDVEKVNALQKESYICMAPTSVWFTKQFPQHKWVDLLNDATIQNYKVYLLGAPADKSACGTIFSKTTHKNVVNLCGELNLLQSAALMQNAVMNYVNDSAPMHLCSSVNAPVTAIYCSTVPSFGFGPLSNSSHMVETQQSLDCRPCGMHGFKQCPKGHFNCAEQIEVKQLVASL